MPFCFAHGSSESLKPCVWSPPKPNMICTVFLAPPLVLPPPASELELPELRQPVVSSVTDPATAATLVTVRPRMCFLPQTSCVVGRSLGPRTFGPWRDFCDLVV